MFSEEAMKVMDTADLEKQADGLSLELESISGKLDALIKKNAVSASNQEEYRSFYDELSSEFDRKQAEFEKVTTEISSKKARKTQLELFIKELKKSRVCKEFSEELFRNLVEKLLVSPEGKITVVYKSGMKL